MAFWTGGVSRDCGIQNAGTETDATDKTDWEGAKGIHKTMEKAMQDWCLKCPKWGGQLKIES